MKKNIYKIGAAALLIGTIILSSISVQATQQNTVGTENSIPDSNSNVNFEEKDGLFDNSKQDELNWPHHTIDYFELCSISGKYTTKTSSDEYQIIVGSDTKSITVVGWAWILDLTEIPQLRFYITKTDSVKIKTFKGNCKNGYIYGIGLEVYIGNYDL